MFRNALRQSSRSVAAVQATGRIASVSPSHPGHPQSIAYPTCSISNPSSIRSPGSRLLPIGTLRMARICRRLQSSSLTSFSSPRFARLSPAPSPAPPSRSVPTLPRPRPPPPRSLPSWSSAFVVFRRRLVSLRPVVFCRSGTSIPSPGGSGREKFAPSTRPRPSRPRPPSFDYSTNQKLIMLRTVTVLPVSTA